MNLRAAGPDRERAIASTRAWIERAVIGLNLCPFAKAIYVNDQIRYVVSAAATPQELAPTWPASCGDWFRPIAGPWTPHCSSIRRS